jgi:hypothetical protein
MKNNNQNVSGNSRRIISVVDYGRIMSKIEGDMRNDILPELLHRLYLIVKKARIISLLNQPEAKGNYYL